MISLYKQPVALAGDREREKTVHLIGERVMGLEVSYHQDVKFDMRDWSDQRGWFPDVKVGHLTEPEPWLL